MELELDAVGRGLDGAIARVDGRDGADVEDLEDGEEDERLIEGLDGVVLGVTLGVEMVERGVDKRGVVVPTLGVAFPNRGVALPSLGVALLSRGVAFDNPGVDGFCRGTACSRETGRSSSRSIRR